MRRSVSGLLAGAAMLQFVAVPAGAQDSVRIFKPAGQWAADFGDDYCRLARNFSDGDDTISLALERIEPGSGMRFVLVGDAIKPYRSADELGWAWLPSVEEHKNRYLKSTTGDGQGYFNLGMVTLQPMPPLTPGTPPAPAPYDRDAEQAVAKAVTGIRLATGLTQAVELQTGKLDAPIKVLQACTDDLVQSWGVDFEKNKTATRPLADGMGSGWLPQGTVPFGDFARLGGGSNMVRLMVDAGGKATSCTIHWATLDKSVNDKICSALMKSAHFTPARDAEGNAMASYWFGSPLSLAPPFPGGSRR